MPVAEKTTRIPHFDIKIEGESLNREAMAAVLEWVVESSLHLPDLCSLRIYDYGFKWLDSDLFKEGNSIELAAGWSPSELTILFEGEIVGLEMDMAAHHSATILVRAYDLSHRLHRGRKCLPFVDVKDSDVVKQIAGKVGLSVDAKATKVVREWVLQNNQTDWEFLTERARRNGYDLFMKANKLHFLPAGERKEFAKVPLEWGQELRSFRPRTAASQQVGTVEVRGWDPRKKQEIVAQAKKPKGVPKTGGDADGSHAAHRFGEAKTYVVDQPVHSVEEAEILAQSVRDQLGQGFLTADGLCDGIPSLMAGTTVDIQNIGERFKGEYYVTSAVHTFSAAEGYSTHFEVNGTQPNNVLSLLGHDATTSPIGGNLVVGVVTNNRDPEGLGRVKVKYPWMADDLASGWARVVSQMAGGSRGMFNLPEIGDEVLVAFEHGETSRPYVLGQLWNGKDKPPSAKGNPELGGSSEVNRRGFHTREGHQLNFDDTGGKGGIEILTTGGNFIYLDDANQNITVRTTNGNLIVANDKDKNILITSTDKQTVLIDDAGKQIVIQDNGGDSVVLDAAGGIVNVHAKNTLNLSAKDINVDAQLGLSLSGLTASVSALASLSLEGKASVGITSLVSVATQAAQVSLEGMEVNIEGAMVNINS